tara:strand:+ start:277 stop:834 length:558 start_codon:yes stop_codon:yes gene_type:complete
MLCKNCRKAKAESNLKHLGLLCDRCFSKIFEKRIRKYVRVNKIFRKGDNVLVSDELSNYLIKSITKDLPIKIYFKKNINTKNIINKNKLNKKDKIVIPWTLDDEINSFLENLLFNKKNKGVKGVKLLKPVTDDEAKVFAKIKGLSFKENKKGEEVYGFLKVLGDKYPDIKFSLLKSVGVLEKIKK